MGANLALARLKKKMAAAVVQLAGLVLCFNLAYDRLGFKFQRSTACCLYLYGARLKSEPRACGTRGRERTRRLAFGV
jgi:hypothetical protein